MSDAQPTREELIVQLADRDAQIARLERERDAAYAEIAAAAAGGEVHDAITRAVWDAPAGRYAAPLARCAAPTRCLFVEVRAATAEERGRGAWLGF